MAQQWRWFGWALLGLLPLTLPAKSKFFPNTWGDIIVNTDMTPFGRERTPPSLEHPVTYVGDSLGLKFGSIRGDRIPPDKEVVDFVVDVLAQQGYIGVKSLDENPELYITLQWGYLEPPYVNLYWFLGYDPSKDIAASNFPGALGPEVFRRNLRDPKTETIVRLAKEPMYGIIIVAFDFESASTPQPIILWQTRIAVRAARKTMAEALPNMVLAAGPSIGRETTSPVFHDVDDLLEGKVEMGDLEEVPAQTRFDPEGPPTPLPPNPE